MQGKRHIAKLLDQETWDAMRKAGYSEEELLAQQPLGPLVYSYTRRQAIDDGVLIDITEMARAEGFKVHTAITCGLHAEVTQSSPPEVRPLLLRALLRELQRTIRRQAALGDTDRVQLRLGPVALWAHIGPGDEGEPVMTLMLEGED